MGSCYTPFLLWGFPGGVSGKNRRASAGDIRDSGLIPGSGRPPGGGHGNPLQCSCLENPMDRGAWPATVHGVAKSQTRLKWLSRHASSCMEKGQKLISGETSQLRNTRENCQKARGALRPEPQEKRWKGTWGLVWKDGDTEPGRSHGESGVLVHALWDVDPEHESWGHIHHDSLTGVLLPPFYRQGLRSCSRITGDMQLIVGRAALKPSVKARACSQHSIAGWMSPGRTVRFREWVPGRLILRPRQWSLSHN